MSFTQLAFNCLKFTIETLGGGMKYRYSKLTITVTERRQWRHWHSSGVSIVNF